MRKDREIKRYADERLRAYAGGDSSLEELKRAQGVKKNRAVVTKVAWSLSAVAAVVLLALGIVYLPTAFSSNGAETAMDASSGSNPSLVEESGSATSKDSLSGNKASSGSGMNAETKYVDVVFRTGDEGIDSEHRYEMREGDVEMEIVVGFPTEEERSEETFEKSVLLAGQTFRYDLQEGENLRIVGLITTDREVVAVEAEGPTEGEILSAIASRIVEKQK